MASAYTAKDIEVLEGLEPVRKRPAMYIGGTDTRGYHHLLWEIVDNSVDEVINGHATRIDGDARTRIGKASPSTDNGRGIPVDIIPKSKKSALEVILTTLHAGGKFDAGQLPATPAVCTASARRWSTRWPRRGRRGPPRRRRVAAALQARQADGERSSSGARARAPARPSPSAPTRRSSASALASTPRPSRQRLEDKSYLHRGLKITFIGRDRQVDVADRRVRAPRAASPSTSTSWVAADRNKFTVPCANLVLLGAADEGPELRDRAGVDRGRPTSAMQAYVNGVPHARWRHARAMGLSRPAWERPCATT